jgi:HSP20 family molecular chaperone IbpA
LSRASGACSPAGTAARELRNLAWDAEIKRGAIAIDQDERRVALLRRGFAKGVHARGLDAVHLDDDVAWSKASASEWSPAWSLHGLAAVTLRDTPESIVYEIEAPGYRRSELNIEVRDRVVTIRGARTRGWFKPRWQSSFSHSFALPETVDPSGVDATLDGNVLSLVVEKYPFARRRQIPISSREAGLPASSSSATKRGETSWQRANSWLRDTLGGRWLLSHGPARG